MTTANKTLDVILERLPKKPLLSPREIADACGFVTTAPLIMGEGLCRICEVRRDGTMQFKDETTLRKVQVVAQLASGEVLTKGDRYKVWVNPLEGSTAYVCDVEGRYLGTAAVMVATNPDDTEESLKNLGIRQKAIATRMEELKPYIAAKRREAAQMARVNAEAIEGVDPVALEQQSRAALSRTAPDVSDADLLPPEETGNTFEYEVF